MTNVGLRLTITICAVLVLTARRIFPDLTIDTVTLILLLVAALPWLSSLIKSAELPGGWRIEFQDIQSAGDKVTAGAITSPVTETTPDLPVAVLEGGDPNLVLVALRIEIEKRLRALAERKGISTQRSLWALNEILRREGVLHASEASGLAELIEAGNQAAHGARVPPGVPNWAAKNAPQILRALDAKLEA